MEFCEYQRFIRQCCLRISVVLFQLYTVKPPLTAISVQRSIVLSILSYFNPSTTVASLQRQWPLLVLACPNRQNNLLTIFWTFILNFASFWNTKVKRLFYVSFGQLFAWPFQTEKCALGASFFLVSYTLFYYVETLIVCHS